MTIGKKNSTLIKQTVKESKLLTTGVKNLKFWHEASQGDTAISFGSLSLPVDIANQGLSNPSSTEILSANLALFHTNVEVHSSLNQKLMEGLTYVVKNSQIKFVNNYTATQGEIFAVVYKNDVITGNNIVDAKPLTSTGTLPIGNQDFNVGEAFKINANPNDQIGDVMVFVDGVIQYRNVGNATAAPAADGNYEEVNSAGGFGTIIRFNQSFAAVKNIIVVSRNLIAERPDISMMQFIDKIGGQLDAVIPTVASLAGVPESDFQIAPNNIDLKTFGDAVTNLNKILNVEVFTEENNFSARISNNGTASIVSQNHPFIQSVAIAPLGRVEINFIPGFFSQTPNIVGSVSETLSFGNYLVEFDSISTTSVTVRTFDIGSNVVVVDFDIQVSRQGSDYKNKVKIKDLI